MDPKETQVIDGSQHRWKTRTQVAERKTSLSIPPLVLEGVTATRVELNKRIVAALPEVKLADIQMNRNNGTSTLMAADVKSFNAMLTGGDKLTTGTERAQIRIPRSIQRIINTDKEAFVKLVDLDISEDDIRTELERNGFKIESIARLQKEDNLGPTLTIKVAFLRMQRTETPSSRLGFKSNTCIF